LSKFNGEKSCLELRREEVRERREYLNFLGRKRCERGEDSNGNNEGGSDKLQWLLSEEAEAFVFFCSFRGVVVMYTTGEKRKPFK
jgi:hypothetical protein